MATTQDGILCYLTYIFSTSEHFPEQANLACTMSQMEIWKMVVESGSRRQSVSLRLEMETQQTQGESVDLGRLSRLRETQQNQEDAAESGRLRESQQNQGD